MLTAGQINIPTPVDLVWTGHISPDTQQEWCKRQQWQDAHYPQIGANVALEELWFPCHRMMGTWTTGQVSTCFNTATYSSGTPTELPWRWNFTQVFRDVNRFYLHASDGHLNVPCRTECIFQNMFSIISIALICHDTQAHILASRAL